jgi:hypothetical protein
MLFITLPLPLPDFIVRKVGFGALDWTVLVTFNLAPISFGVPLLPPPVYKICVSFRPIQEIGESVNVKMDDYTYPTGAKVDTIYTVIALRYTVDCLLINPNPQICLWIFFCP